MQIGIIYRKLLSQSKSPEYSYSFTDVAGFLDLTVRLINNSSHLLVVSQPHWSFVQPKQFSRHSFFPVQCLFMIIYNKSLRDVDDVTMSWDYFLLLY